MTKYSREPVDASKAVKARGSNLRVHYKNTRETAMALKGMSLKRAQAFLEDVIAHRDTVAFRRHKGGVGRTAQAKRHGVTQSRWPEKSCRFMLDLLQNAESNADIQGLEADTLYVYHIQVNRASQLRRRTYRAHGRINPYMSSPCHVEVILAQKSENVKKEAEESQPKRGRKARGGQLENGATANVE